MGASTTCKPGGYLFGCVVCTVAVSSGSHSGLPLRSTQQHGMSVPACIMHALDERPWPFHATPTSGVFFGVHATAHIRQGGAHTTQFSSV